MLRSKQVTIGVYLGKYQTFMKRLAILLGELYSPYNLKLILHCFAACIVIYMCSKYEKSVDKFTALIRCFIKGTNDFMFDIMFKRSETGAVQ